MIGRLGQRRRRGWPGASGPPRAPGPCRSTRRAPARAAALWIVLAASAALGIVAAGSPREAGVTALAEAFAAAWAAHDLEAVVALFAADAVVRQRGAQIAVEDTLYGPSVTVRDAFGVGLHFFGDPPPPDPDDPGWWSGRPAGAGPGWARRLFAQEQTAEVYMPTAVEPPAPRSVGCTGPRRSPAGGSRASPRPPARPSSSSARGGSRRSRPSRKPLRAAREPRWRAPWGRRGRPNRRSRGRGRQRLVAPPGGRVARRRAHLGPAPARARHALAQVTERGRIAVRQRRRLGPRRHPPMSAATVRDRPAPGMPQKRQKPPRERGLPIWYPRGDSNPRPLGS